MSAFLLPVVREVQGELHSSNAELFCSETARRSRHQRCELRHAGNINTMTLSSKVEYQIPDVPGVNIEGFHAIASAGRGH
jgi:hypothetical protein